MPERIMLLAKAFIVSTMQKHGQSEVKAKWKPRLIEIYKICLYESKMFLPNRDFTFIKPAFHFGGTFFSRLNISSRFAGAYCMLQYF